MLYKEKLDEILNNDGVIAFVTDTVWGLGCLVSNQKAVERIYAIKERERSKPLILMSDSAENLIPYAKDISPKAKQLMDQYFPGALTLVLEKSDLTPDYVTQGLDTVGIRVPDNKVFQQICSGKVLATTSANHSGEPPAMSHAEAVKYIGDKVDMVIEDFGFAAQGTASTVAGVFGDEIKIFRQGNIYLNP